MTREEILSTLIEILKEATDEPVNWDEVDEATEAALVVLDSLAILELVFGIRHRFDIPLKVEDLDGVQTVGDVVTLVQRKREGLA